MKGMSAAVSRVERLLETGEYREALHASEWLEANWHGRQLHLLACMLLQVQQSGAAAATPVGAANAALVRSQRTQVLLTQPSPMY